MPDEGRRLDDVQVVLVRRGGEVVIDDERARPRHRGPVLLERLAEGRGVVVLDRVGDLLGRRSRLDLVAERVARSLLGDEQLLTDREDLVSIGLELPQANHLLEALGSGLPVGRRAGEDVVAEPRRVLGERRLRRVGRGLEAPRDVVADSLGAGRGHDRVEEGRQLLGRLEVDLGPQAHRIGHPLARLGQERRRLLEPRDHALDPIHEWRKVAGEQREQRLADVLGRLRGAGPWLVLGQPVEAEPSLMDGKIAIEPALRAQLAGVDGGELIDRAAVERDLLVDGVAPARREIAVVVVQARGRWRPRG